MQWNRNNHFRRWVITSFDCRYQLHAEHMATGQIPTEFEAANQLVNRELVIQPGNAKAPGRRVFQAVAADRICVDGKSESTSATGVLIARQFGRAGGTKVTFSAGHATCDTVPGQKLVQHSLKPWLVTSPRKDHDFFHRRCALRFIASCTA